MNADKDTWHAAKDKTLASSNHAPQPVLMALMSLMDPRDVTHWLAQNHERGNETRWHVTWISAEAVLTCSATKAYGGWAMDSCEERQDADSLEVSLRPLGQVSGVELVHIRRHGLGVSANWEIEALVQMEKGDPLRIPAIPEGRYETAQAEAVLRRLCQAVR